MARHSFNFDGGGELTTYNRVEKTHTNWKNVSTYNNRISTYNRTQSYHTHWLKQIVHMNENNLDKNTIGLKGYEVIEMANKLLQENSFACTASPPVIT